MSLARDGEWSEPTRITSPFLNLTSSEWNPEFSTRRLNVKLDNENVRWIDTVDIHEGLARTFMTSSEESESCLPRADKVEEYCFGASIEDLKIAGGEADKLNVALLDERSSVKGMDRSREYRGPLTAHHLYVQLLKPRYHSVEFACKSDDDFSDLEFRENSSKRANEEPEQEPDAERRKIFITNLDRWGILALMGTASENQVPGLRDTIYKYLAFESFIGVLVPHRGISMFQLVFHIPFYAWRVSQNQRYDHRLSSSAKRLREAQDVSLFNFDKSGRYAFLYEAQYSCLISGLDEWNWVAYCFVDTYFNHEARDTVEGYHNVSLESGPVLPDPLTCGTSDLNRTVPTSRGYFICVLQNRISQAEREWRQIVANIQDGIRDYDEWHHSNSLYMSRDRSASAKEHNCRVRRLRDWIFLARRLTLQLLQQLNQTVGACQKFCFDDAGYFLDPSVRKGLKALQNIFRELESLLKTLKFLAERCEGFFLELEHVRKIEMGSKTSWLDNFSFLNSLMGKLPTNPNSSALYRQLSFRSSEVRLLKFMAPWTGMVLVCSLITVPLPNAPKYAALSYHWGEQKRKVSMRMNNFDFQVTANLYGALLRLRAEGIQHVWADALCINQEDSDEKSFQVSRMGAIFQKASQVAVWLGAEPRASEEMQKLQRDSSYPTLDPYLNSIPHATFDELLSRPYWNRVWIIQEVALAAEVVVYFGRCRITWDNFISGCGLCLESATPSTGLPNDNSRGIATLIQFRRDKLVDRPINFLEALYRSRSSLSTDPRDKLFATLGLSFNGNNFIPEPNYMHSPEAIFTEFMTALLKSPAPLDYIYLRSASRNKSDKLPSWVPVWTDLDDVVARRQFDYIIQGPSKRSRYNGFEWKDSINISETELTISGLIIDTVDGLGSIFARGSGDIDAPTFTSSQQMVRSDLSPGPEAARIVYEAITGVGLLVDRAYDDKVRYYANADGHSSDDQALTISGSPQPDHETKYESTVTIKTWLAANSSFNIAGWSLKCWWNFLCLRGAKIGDVLRITGHFDNSIRCGMRLLATQKGFIGWIHPQAQPGDKIVRVFGCSQHVVLRAVQKRYRVVGDAILIGAEIGDHSYIGCKEELRLI